jgi:muramidase (phage lysozyme)
MAVAYKSVIDVSKISRSTFTLGKGITKAESSTFKINSSLVNLARFKRESLANDRNIFQKRREAVRRREQEDLIEASGIGGAIKRQTKVIASSTKGFLGRIFDFIATLMVGWLINNLPFIIKLGQELIKRIQKLFATLSGFIGGIVQFFSGFGQFVSATFSDLRRFDFSDDSGMVRRSMTSMKYGMTMMERSINNALALLQEPLDLSLPKPKSPSPDQTPDQSEMPSTTSSEGTGGGRATGIHKQALDIISKYESATSGGYDAMNQGQRNANSPIVGGGDSKDILKKPLTAMTIGEVMKRGQYQQNPNIPMRNDYGVWAAGRYQLIPGTLVGAMKAAGLTPNDAFSPGNQDKMALALIKQNGLQSWGWDATSASRFSPKEKEIISKAQRTTPTFDNGPTTPPQTNPQTPRVSASAPQPPELKPVGSGRFLAGSAADSFLKMRGAASAQGIDLGLTSAYRDSKKQAELYYGYIHHLPGYALAAPPGHSMHEKGLAIDVAQGPDLDWMYKNAPKFGWKFKNIPGENWHFEYQGGGGITPQVAQFSAPQSGVNRNLAPDRTGPTVVVNQPPPQPQPQPQVSGGGQSSNFSSGFSDEIPLNRFITQRLLLDLSYT